MSKVSSKIEMVGVESLKDYERNARSHSAEQVDQIANSITKFGFTAPVLIGKDGGILAGHGRVMAARKLEMAEVPCVRLAHLSEAERRAYIIADNKIAQNAGWDYKMLENELRSLGSDIDLTGLGFTDDELDVYLGDFEVIEPVIPAQDEDGPIVPMGRFQNNLSIIGKGKNVGFRFGDHMVVISRELYDEVSNWITGRTGDKRDAIEQMLSRGIGNA